MLARRLELSQSVMSVARLVVSLPAPLVALLFKNLGQLPTVILDEREFRQFGQVPQVEQVGEERVCGVYRERREFRFERIENRCAEIIFVG